jgi:transposase InsO family protein
MAFGRWPAAFPCHDHRQSARTAHRPQPVESQLHRGRAQQAWAGDITYIQTEEGRLFLAVVIDLFSRRVVGWSLQPDIRCDLVIDALKMAWFQRSPNHKAGPDLP